MPCDYSAGNSYRLRISGYPKIDTIPKIDDFGGSRKNTQKIQKIYKIDDSGGTQKNTKIYTTGDGLRGQQILKI